MSLDRYGTHGPKFEWIAQFFEFKESFPFYHTLGTEMYIRFLRFLRDAALISARRSGEALELTPLGKKLCSLRLSDSCVWGIMLVNLSYSKEVSWLVRNLAFNETISRSQFADRLMPFVVSKFSAYDIFAASRRICSLPFSEVGLGAMTLCGNEWCFCRTRWLNPNPCCLIYALRYLSFIEKRASFGAAELSEWPLDREGLSPCQIFGIRAQDIANQLEQIANLYPDLAKFDSKSGIIQLL